MKTTIGSLLTKIYATQIYFLTDSCNK